METRTYNVYKFDELTDEQKQKAVDHLCHINVDHEWWDGVYMDAERVGLKITGFDIGRSNECTMEYIEDACHTAHAIDNEHGEGCDTYIHAASFLAERDEIVNSAEIDEDGELADEYALDQELDELEADFLRTLSEDYLSNLRSEYQYLISEEQIIETIEANDYWFTEDGKISS